MKISILTCMRWKKLYVDESSQARTLTNSPGAPTEDVEAVSTTPRVCAISAAPVSRSR